MNAMTPFVRYMSDTLQNFISGLGTAKDKSYHNTYGLFVLDQAQLEAAYRGDWVARKIINAPAQDATREWRAWKANEHQIELIEEEERRLGLQGKIHRALIRGRLYGGGALIMSFKGHNSAEPLDIETVNKGDLQYVHVVSRYALGCGALMRDPISPYFNEPEYYELKTTSMLDMQVRIHPSRIIRFIGGELPDPDAAGADHGWGDSVLQSVDDAVKNVGLCEGGIAALIQESKIDIIRIPNLMANIGTTEYKDRLTERFTLSNQAKSLINTLLMDKEEEWDRINVNFAGMPEVLKIYLLIASGAADIPATRLLGQSPAGLNSTGESDTRNYYDRISSDQNNELRPLLTRLDEALIRSSLGNRPREIYYDWRPLWQMTADEQSQIAHRKAQVFQIDVNSGVMDLEVMRQARQNQLVEDGTYPGIDQIIQNVDPAEIDMEEVKEEEKAEKEAALKIATAAKGNGKENGREAEDASGGGTDRGATRRAQIQRIKDAAPRALYVYRKVTNAEEILYWARGEGFSDLLDDDDLHVTVLYSKAAVDWLKMGEPYDGLVEVKAGGPRVVEPLGDEGAVVLQFASTALQWRHHDMCERGASHDYEEYIPHITLTYGGYVDIKSVTPYRGKILLGPEIFEEITS